MSQLMTRWLCICQEGPTVDGRLIQREWIVDAAELYDADKYTAMIWPEHERIYNAAGRVLEVKAEENKDGEMCLMARLCPNEQLIYANKSGQLLFCSAEFTPDGNWRGTGKSYLEGLGVTNSPASVGTTRLQFNRNKGKRLSDFKTLVFEELAEINEQGEGEALPKEDNKMSWRKLFNMDEPKQSRQFAEQPPADPAPSSDEKLNALATALDSIEQGLGSLGDAVEKIKGVLDTQEFADLRDNLPKVLSNFKKMEDIITEKPGANPAGDDNKNFNFL